MPDSPPQSTKNPHQRFSVGVTRVCLTSGTLQIPFAMRGVFEPGTYQARDTELEETHELAFEPPRSLHGLDKVFAAHELHPNDEVILTLTKEGLELEVAKRPRRKAANVKGEPWESVSGPRAGAPAQPAPAPRSEGAAHDDAYPEDRPAARRGHEDARHRAHEPAGPHDEQDSDAPRMVRARRIQGKEGNAASSPRQPLGRPQSRPASSEVPANRRSSAAQRFFEDPGDPDDPFSADGPTSERMADDAWHWERDAHLERSERFDEADAFVEDEGEPQGGGFFAKIAQAARGALSFRGGEREDEHPEPERSRYVHPHEEASFRPEPAHPDPQRSEPPRSESARFDAGRADAAWAETGRSDAEHADPHRTDATYADAESERRERSRARPERPEPHRSPPDRPEAVRPESHGSAPGARPSHGRQLPQADPRRQEAPRPRPGSEARPQAQDARPRQAAEAARRDVVVEDPERETTDRFGPAMLEVGEGDLRSRLVRFLQHPDVPVILRTDVVARNFGLGEEVAEAMLEDLTHDKIDGLVVTKVRDETYRISRAPSKL